MTKVRVLMWSALVAATAACVVAAMPPRDVVSAKAEFPTKAPSRRIVDALPVEEPEPENPFARDGVAVEPADEAAAAPEMGDATLRLCLRGDTDDRPVATTARLWRLDVPENVAWTAGDEERAALDVTMNGVELNRLPRGRYRLQLLGGRAGASDPPAFELTAGVNERVITVANRRWFRLRLLIVDELGVPVQSALRSPGGSGFRIGGSETPAPSWARPRRRRHGEGTPLGWSSHGLGHACGPGAPDSLVRADSDGFFDLGTHLERGAGDGDYWHPSYRVESRTDVDVAADDAIAMDTAFVGVAARIDVLVAHVVGPDGGRLDPAAATIDAECVAVRCPWSPPADAWRTVPVHVKVVAPGCEPLEFDWTAATADVERRLVRSRR